MEGLVLTTKLYSPFEGNVGGDVFSFDLAPEGTLRDAVAVELTELEFSAHAAPTFLGHTDAVGTLPPAVADVRDRAACTIDLVVSDPAAPSDPPMVLSIDLEKGGVNYCNYVMASTAAMLTAVQAAVAAALAATAGSGAAISGANTSVSVWADEYDRLRVAAFRTAGPNEPLKTAFPCLTGPGSIDTAARALGFLAGNDKAAAEQLSSTPAKGSGENYVLAAPLPMTTTPFRYIDVFLRGAEIDGRASEPTARVFFDFTGITERVPIVRRTARRVCVFPRRARMLGRVRVEARLPGGLLPCGAHPIARRPALTVGLLAQRDGARTAYPWLNQNLSI